MSKLSYELPTITISQDLVPQRGLYSTLMDTHRVMRKSYLEVAKAHNKVADKLAKELVSVRDFGAVGDGVTDDTAAIQAAIDAVVSGVILFPKPTAFWRTTAPIVLPAGVQLVFEGASEQDVAVNYIKPDTGVSPAILVQRRKGIRLDGVCVDASNLVAGAIAFDIDGMWWGVLRGCRVINLSDSTVVGFRIKASTSPTNFGTYWNTYEDCSVTGTAGIGWQLLGVPGGPRVNLNTFVNCRAGNITTGWDVDETGAGIVLVNCNGENCSGNGLEVGTISSGTFITLVGGEFSGNGGWGATGVGNVHAINVVAAANVLGDFDSNVVVQKGANFSSSELRAKSVVYGIGSQVVAATDTIQPTHATVSISGSGGAVTLTSTPTIAAPSTSGARIKLVGASNVDWVQLQDETVLAGSGLFLKSGLVQLKRGYSITLEYDAGIGGWYEIARSAPQGGDWSGIINVTVDRSYDANATTVDELADVLGTLIQDLRDCGVLR